jgi:hypothetical protein
MTSQFHKFLNLIFGGILLFGPTVQAGGRALLMYTSKLIEVAGYNSLTAYDFTRYKFSSYQICANLGKT